MSKCGAVDERGFSCVDEAGHPGEHWFQRDANICDVADERGYVCHLRPAHEGDHRFHIDITPRGSAARVCRVDDDPDVIRQREIDALNPPPDPMAPDNSDLEDFADVLPPREQVALWAGRILRKEAQIESMLQMIHCELSGGGKVPRVFERLCAGIVEMLPASQIADASYVDDCLETLDRLRQAHAVRNRVVHDQWVMRQDAPGEYVAVTVSKGITESASAEVRWALPAFRECYEELRICSVMVSGIFWSIGSFVGEHSELSRDMLPQNREAIAGRVKLQGENHWEFTDPAFVAQLTERMERQAEKLRQQMTEHLPGSSPEDEL
ncbi:MAG: hypothetical protein CVT68_07155 [Actinobacteria bacterium HGW-Actinobacteria-8]|nr:MAG: hypothetical protein CVT68_07155 [Actinobacteria bacterium HGW-Actinobacteria-8]